MNTNALKTTLAQHPDRVLRIALPDGSSVPARFHVTEVGHVSRRFIDCGGTVRTLESCLLQAWVPDGDVDHRLTAGKLANIFDVSRRVLPSDELEVEVEYGAPVVSQYTVNAADLHGGELVLTLGNKQTDCLAREVCGVEPAAAGRGASECCGGKGCGCS